MTVVKLRTRQGELVAGTDLARIDALAAKLVARASPITFGAPRTAEERDAIYRLRYEVVVEKGWGSSADYPDGMERDKYDEAALQVGAWDGATLVGTCRLVFPETGRLLPTEEAFDIAAEPRGHVADVGRVCVAPTYRGTGYRVLWGLLCQAWVELRPRGFTRACTVLSPSASRMYRNWGLRVVVLGEAREYKGEQRYPALVEPDESDPAILERIVELHTLAPR